MNARRDLYAALMAGGPHSPDRSEKASEKIDAHRAEVLAEVTAWLIKKAREFHASSRKAERAQGDTCAVLASKIARGAVRSNNLRMLPNAGFFEVDHTYASSDPAYDWKFRVDAITTSPEDGELTALGWRHFHGQWEPYEYGAGDWEIHQSVGTIDVTEGGDGR